MNAKKLIAAATVLVATGSAFAQPNAEFVEFNDFVSTKSRAEVRAELEQAQAAGQLAGNTEYVEFIKVASTAPCKELRASNDYSLLEQRPEYVEFTNVPSTRTRAEVRNEVLQAAKSSKAVIGG